MGEDFEFDSYGIFSDGVQNMNTLNDCLSDNQPIIDTSRESLKDESIFMGPICDSCVEGFESADKRLSTMIASFTTMANYLVETAENYDESDTEAARMVLNMGADGVVSTKLSSITYNGKTIYYNQNGYIGDDGQWHTWQSTWGKDIASSGCGPTSMAAVLANMFGDSTITPATVANMLAYDDNVGGNYVIKVANAYGLDQTHEIGSDQQIMNSFLSNGGKMIVAVNGGGHYISVLGINNSTSPPTYIVCDPNDANTATRTWTYNDIFSDHTMVFHIAPPGQTVQETINGNRTAVQV